MKTISLLAIFSVFSLAVGQDTGDKVVEMILRRPLSGSEEAHLEATRNLLDFVRNVEGVVVGSSRTQPPFLHFFV